MEQGRGGAGTGLREGRGAGHVVQFYKSDGFLAETVGKFVADGIRAGEGVVVVATAPHRDGIRERLRALGVNVPAAEAAGQYVGLDAAELLATFMIDGMPDPRRFAEVFGGILARTWKQHLRVARSRFV